MKNQREQDAYILRMVDIRKTFGELVANDDVNLNVKKGSVHALVGENGAVLACGGEFIGFATSRVAEYYAMKAGIEKAIELGLRTVRVVADNLMMVNQMKGIYKVKNRDLLAIYDDIQGLLGNFDACAFVHVMREQNQQADAQANRAIDNYFEK